MARLNFSEEFADLVESGRKTQTLRRPRRRPIVYGERLSLWHRFGTPEARKLGEGIVYQVTEIEMDEGGELWVAASGLVRRDWTTMTPSGKERVATLDGFETWDALVAWFRSNYGLPFNGHLIRWRLLPREEWARPVEENET